MKLWGNNQKQKDNKTTKAEGIKDRQTRAVVILWLMPVLVLLFVIVIMLINYFGKAQKLGREKVATIFSNNTVQYSSAFYNEIEAMTKTMVPFSLTMEKMRGAPIDIAVETASILEDNSPAELVIICGTDGMGIDGGGRYVDVSAQDYYQQFDGTEQQYLYVGHLPGNKMPAIVSVVPILKNNNTEGYILGYYTMESFEALTNKIEHDNDTFYGIVDEGGNLLVSYGTNSTFLREVNLLETLDKATIYDGSTSYTRQRVQKFLKGSLSASYQGESRIIFHAPLHINGWQFIMGVNQSYADLLLQEEVRETRAFVQRLIKIMCAFFALIVGINFFNRLRTNENSKELEKQADTDLLTGLNNKIATERKIKEYIKCNDSQALMFLLDIDNFKKINDTMGHAFGDEVLRALGFGLAAEFRVSDILGRTGGDEFMIFLKNIKDQSIIDKEVSRVVRFFHEFAVGDVVKYSATASIGCAVYPRDADSFENLYKAADKALYKAKKRGKNQLAFYVEETVKSDKPLDNQADK